jgi:hypothetical protein
VAGRGKTKGHERTLAGWARKQSGQEWGGRKKRIKKGFPYFLKNNQTHEFKHESEFKH